MSIGVVKNMKCIFIYNPNSGKGKVAKKKDYIFNKLKEKFDEVEMIATQYPKHALLLADEVCEKCDYLIFSGGDGTFNEIVQGVASHEKRPILGYIPTGTVNDNAKNLGMSKNIKKSLKIILNDKQIDMDICKIGNQYFSYVAALGSFSAISYATKQRSKKVLGALAYALNGIDDFFHTKNFDVKITLPDGRIYENNCAFLGVLNSRSVGGFRFNKEADISDGLIDFVMVDSLIYKERVMSICSSFRIFNLFLRGIKKKRDVRHVTHFIATSAKIELSDNVVWCLDGEKGESGSKNIEMLHHHLKIITKG